MSNISQGKLQIRTEMKDGELHLYMSGPLNEDSLFTSVPVEPTAHLHIHLDEVTSINSTGIRQWLLWVKDYADAGWQLWGCPPHFINQLNMINQFVPSNSRVRSFYIPYFSDETNEETRILIDRETWDKNKSVAQAPLDSSGNPMEPDFLEDRFFKFSSRY